MFGQPVQVTSWVPTVHHETTPAHLSLLACLTDVEPPLWGAGSHFLDLGCGRGLSALMLAAANSDALVHGVDSDPVSIASARRLARLAGLSNVTFTERSFAELEIGTLPSFDFISANLVYSYVAGSARAALRNIVREKLVSGGIFALDFVPLPGAGSILAACSLMREHAHHSDGSVEERAAKAMEFLRTLIREKYAMFGQVPGLDQMLAGDRAAMVHEYFNRDYRPFFEHELTRDIEGLGLSFLGNCVLSLNDDRLCLDTEHQKVCQSVNDLALRRMLKAYALNLTRSSCAYIRGFERRGAAPLGARHFFVVRPPSGLPETATIGQVNANTGPARHRLKRLIGTAWSLSDFMKAFDVELDGARQWLAVLADAQTIQIVRPTAAAAAGSAPPRLNEVLLAENESPMNLLRLASPVTGAAVSLPGDLSLMARAHFRKPNDIMSAAHELVRQHQLAFQRDGQTLDEKAAREALEMWAGTFEEEALPILKALVCL